MKQHILSFYFLLISSIGFSQIKEFKSNDDYARLIHGDTLIVVADTAYVVSITRAEFINQKLDELDEIQTLYNDLTDNRNELLNELKKTHKTLGKLLVHMQGDATYINNDLTTLINELNQSLSDLKTNNETLKNNNVELGSKVAQLQRLVSELKKETRGLWWNGVADKLVAFAGGVGAGVLLVIILQ